MQGSTEFRAKPCIASPFLQRRVWTGLGYRHTDPSASCLDGSQHIATPQPLSIYEIGKLSMAQRSLPTPTHGMSASCAARYVKAKAALSLSVVNIAKLLAG